MAFLNVDRFLRQCANSACSCHRPLWRAWLDPLRGCSLEGHWYCSPECFEQALENTIGQLLPGALQTPAKTHRVPLGLLMLSRGLVDSEQLKRALKAQKDSGSGRVGEWLRHLGAVNEEQVTQMLGLQWSIPVFPLNQSRRYLECAHLVPYPLLELAEMVPVHHLPSSQHLYMAFVDRVNYSALYAVERMLGCHTEPCLAAQSQLHQALREIRNQPRPSEVLLEEISEPGVMAATISALYERLDATEVRVSGFDGFLWSRLLHSSGYADLLFRPQKNHPGFILPPGSGD
ncbi:MAG TPA: hypothetical protein VMO17_06725 [Terriglobia bacterium]|nr:hypothetical protein [Terriglobia bacterium]